MVRVARVSENQEAGLKVTGRVSFVSSLIVSELETRGS